MSSQRGHLRVGYVSPSIGERKAGACRCVSASHGGLLINDFEDDCSIQLASISECVSAASLWDLQRFKRMRSW